MSQDKRQESTLLFGVVFLFIACGMLGYVVGMYQGKHMTRVEAVQRGHAEWVVNAEGETGFVWKGGEKRP